MQDKITEAEEQFAELKSKLKSCSDELDYKERQLRALQVAKMISSFKFQN